MKLTLSASLVAVAFALIPSVVAAPAPVSAPEVLYTIVPHLIRRINSEDEIDWPKQRDVGWGGSTGGPIPTDSDADSDDIVWIEKRDDIAWKRDQHVPATALKGELSSKLDSHWPAPPGTDDDIVWGRALDGGVERIRAVHDKFKSALSK